MATNKKQIHDTTYTCKDLIQTCSRESTRRNMNIYLPLKHINGGGVTLREVNAEQTQNHHTTLFQNKWIYRITRTLHAKIYLDIELDFRQVPAQNDKKELTLQNVIMY